MTRRLPARRRVRRTALLLAGITLLSALSLPVQGVRTSGAAPTGLGVAARTGATSVAAPAASAPPGFCDRYGSVLFTSIPGGTTNQTSVDVGEPFVLHMSTPLGYRLYRWGWAASWEGRTTTLANANSTTNGTHRPSVIGLSYNNSSAAGGWNVSGNTSSAGTSPLYLCAVARNANGTLEGEGMFTLTIDPDMVVQISAVPASGAAPLAVDLQAFVSGGTPPYTISWLTGDQNVGLGKSWNHTYAAPGAYVAKVWVNDTTGNLGDEGSYAQALYVNVTGASGGHGPFGLRGLEGWALVGLLVLAIVGTALYGALTRNRSKRLPPPERWMVAGTEGRAGTAGGPRPPPPPPR